MYTPVYTRLLFDRAVELTVYGACRNWNIAGNHAQEMNKLNPGIVRSIQWIIKTHGIRRALAPKPAFNALIATGAELQFELLQGFFRGFSADGAVLQRHGDAYLLASADCPTTCIYDVKNHRAVGLHCGRDALVDRRHLDEDAETRANASVIDQAIKELTASRRTSPGHLQAFVAAGIGPDSFTHPTSETILDGNGQVIANPKMQSNRRLIQHLLNFWPGLSPDHPIVTDVHSGKIDLAELVLAQLVSNGVPDDQIHSDDCDTAKDRDTKGDFLFHSYRRHRAFRNLVVVHLL